ncbi:MULTISPECIES: methylcobamide:CoM methyltransferase MtaA [Methanosarcina]|jgi:[methyl-Co(III) methanol-specific corrinoid protein]:coenzyme M methyltransferase|uniref:Methylcobamide:CoM methyltransferase n=7 Tax=Methanosarcina mazei TaxID=2209 RepID=A0A0F8KP50_METMZ|nr:MULTISPECIES: methylcobamide:CoM methyltransferase MtaA [Methanosarcina]AAM29872.1 Methylcobalamin:coenzyme M methyltransferase [Methanosarcina mazei Go1]AKB40095.1 Methylcobalamin:coenzyme M methyltransferase, methanol-specific [Methanosarcina mazei WWM610]AKB61048.1 Methylcobalamin:coenzyme M methyltransferase, methanol-specific [Methanosarcina mazei SarPi]AKB64321.1 Methylcobalamin:coenzyme M methyltransferase, methanol-specific [Methanosarcina mazei S-6]AKB67676.1 Methylcobalamin:coenzy
MGDMTLKERLLNALEGKQVDKVPVCSVTQTGIVELMDQVGAPWPEAHSEPELMAKLAIANYEVSGLEAVRVPYCLTVLAEAMGCEVNMGTKNRQPSVTAHPYPKDLEGMEMPENLIDKGRIQAVLGSIKIIREKVGPDVPIIGGMEGPVTLASDLSSVKTFMKWSLKKPDLFEQVLDFATEATIAYANSMALAGADVVAIADPVASPDLMSPDSFKNILQSRLQRFSSNVNSVTVLHVCGNVNPILDYMADCGFEGLSVEEKIGSVKKAKEILGDRTRLVGNISSPFTLLPGPVDKIKTEARQALDDGVDVLAPGCGIAPMTPVSHIKAMVEARDEYYA